MYRTLTPSAIGINPKKLGLSLSRLEIDHVLAYENPEMIEEIKKAAEELKQKIKLIQEKYYDRH